MCFCLVSFLAKIHIFSFWQKTMDYSQAFLSKLSSFFVLLLLFAGRCYDADICTILVPFRCAFAWCPYVRDFDHNLFCQGQFISRTTSTVDSFCTILTVLQMFKPSNYCSQSSKVGAPNQQTDDEQPGDNTSKGPTQEEIFAKEREERFKKLSAWKVCSAT